MRTQLLIVATAALLLASATPAQAQEVGIKNPETSTPTTLYFHIIDVQDMPINTQVPDLDFVDIGSFGPTANTLRCLDPTTNQVTHGTTSQIFHTNYGYSSPSYVEYDYESADGKPRTHPERGISYDAVFDTATPFNVVWYVVVDNTNTPMANAFPTPTPPVQVRVSMRGGDAISIDDKGYDGGPMIAQGMSESVILAPGGANAEPQYSGLPGPQAVPDGGGAPSTATTVEYMGMSQTGQHLYKFTIPMAFEADRITRASGFNVRIDMVVDMEAACNDQAKIDANKEYIMVGTIAPYTDGEHRPTMNFNIMNPIRLEYLHPQFVGDDLVVHTSMNSAWGNYDVGEVNAMTPNVDDSYIQVRIEGPSQATSLAKAALVQRFHEHYHHQEAVDVTYVWPYKTDRAVEGLYTVFVSFKNDQGTAEASGIAQFDIGKGQVIGCGGVQEASQKLNDDCAATIQKDGQEAAEDAPGLGLAAALAALGAVAVLLRRRQA